LAARENDYKAGDTIRGNGAEYLVMGVLGSGGMGAVYAVKDKNIGRRFVLKILHGWLAHRHDLKERFEQEARALGHLSHPGIIEIFQLNRTRDDKQMPYYLMEPLSGESLADSLRRRKKIDLFPALGIATKLLYALEHAHERGVVHRDIKPDNVFLHQGASSEPVVKLLDFGILKLVESEEDPGVFIGTPRFAAPEQLRADPSIGPKADLYSVGVVLFQMVTGHLPFEGYGPGLEEMVHTLIVDAPPITKFGDYPPELVALVARALAKGPEKRPADAFAFASELRTIREALAPDHDDPHTHATAEVIAKVTRAQREPSLITSAHLAAPTSPDDDMEQLMKALHAGAEAPRDAPSHLAAEMAVGVAITGLESTAEERVVPSPARPAKPSGGDARRAAVTALPRTDGDERGSGSVRYLTKEAPRAGGRSAKVEHTAPLLARAPVKRHLTEPMAGRPVRESRPPLADESRTPEPQEVDKRPPRPRMRGREPRSRYQAFARRVEQVVPLRILPWAVAAGTVALVGGFALLRARGVDLTEPARSMQRPATTAAAAPLPLPPPLPVAAAADAGVAPSVEVRGVPATAGAVVAAPATSTRAMPRAAAAMPSAMPPKKKSINPSDVGFE
jgi:serine/threonine protein kinase